jgi:hypothetical protein
MMAGDGQPGLPPFQLEGTRLDPGTVSSHARGSPTNSAAA